MSILGGCCCELESSCDCSLEQAIWNQLQAADGLEETSWYTGGLVTVAELGGQEGPVLPYGVLFDLGANNTTRLGEGCWQHTVLIRARVFAATETEGRSLFWIAWGALRSAGSMCTSEGKACLWPQRPWPRAQKLAHAIWVVSANFTFLVRTFGPSS